MIIIIDGYNLLKQLHVGMYIQEETRQQLLKLFGAYQKKRGHTLIVIFDGGQAFWPIQEEKSGVSVVYAGINKTADDYIKNFITEFYDQDLLLVSSDRELNHWADKHGVVSLNSIPFFQIVKASLESNVQYKKPANLVKISGSDDPILDMLMEDSTVIMKDEDMPRNSEHRLNKDISKLERLLRKKLEKL